MFNIFKKLFFVQGYIGDKDKVSILMENIDNKLANHLQF
jgi:hypothetical protein